MSNTLPEDIKTLDVMAFVQFVSQVARVEQWLTFGEALATASLFLTTRQVFEIFDSDGNILITFDGAQVDGKPSFVAAVQTQHNAFFRMVRLLISD